MLRALFLLIGLLVYASADAQTFTRSMLLNQNTQSIIAYPRSASPLLNLGAVNPTADQGMFTNVIQGMGVLADTNTWTGQNIFLGPLSIPALWFSPMSYGCVGNGVADDTACVQTAINAAAQAGVPLYFDGTHRYFIGSPPLNVASQVDLEGFAPVGNDGIANLQTCTSGLFNWTINASGPNANVSMLSVTAESVIIRNMCIDMAPMTATSYASAGAAIMLCGIDQQGSQIVHNTIFRPYDGIDISGCSPGQMKDSVVRDNIVRDPARYGISMGLGTTCGSAGLTACTGQMEVWNNRVACGDTAASGNGIGIAFFDGSMDFDGTTIGPGSCWINFLIQPGTNQNVNGIFKGVIGDSANQNNFASNPSHELVINNTASSAVVNWLRFVGAWFGGFVPENEVLIENTGGGGCSNIEFNGSNFHGATSQGSYPIVDVEGCFNVIFTGNTIDAWSNGTTEYGIYLNNGSSTAPSHVAITGNHIGTVASAVLTYGIYVNENCLNPDYLTISGNEIGGVLPPNSIVYNQTGGISCQSNLIVMGNNQGVDDQCPTVASATTINISSSPCVSVTGSTTIQNITPAWSRRQIYLSTGASGATLTTGGSGNAICTNLTISANQLAYLVWDTGGQCWKHQ